VGDGDDDVPDYLKGVDKDAPVMVGGWVGWVGWVGGLGGWMGGWVWLLLLFV